MAVMIRSLQVEFKEELAPIMVGKTLGQVLFNPPNVAGWPGGKNWIDNATLMFRLNLGGYLFGASEINMRERADLEAANRKKSAGKLAATLNLQPLGELVTTNDPEQAFETLSAYFLQLPSALSYSSLQPFIAKNNKEDFLKTLTVRLLSLPEYQMC
jgi:hypothetical protein